MMFRGPGLTSKQSRAAIVLVARVLMALLFTFYVNYLTFHLFTERHLDDALSSDQLVAAQLDDQDEVDHDGRDGHHKPHPSSDHSIQILPKSASIALLIAFTSAVTTSVFEAPKSRVSVACVERIWPPGVSPPGPSQPRAPPLA
ncbi:MAG: hypothetical protein DME21_08630 [Verrucomicrobia bacterium]|nr:MAG: hypothetical protein DME21_08630 [Verrucomicrobiota bacterium]